MRLFRRTPEPTAEPTPEPPFAPDYEANIAAHWRD